MGHAASIIRREHDGIAAVLTRLLGVLGEIEAGRTDTDHDLCAAAIDYFDVFLDSVHHPKEDAYLFNMLRQRTTGPGCGWRRPGPIRTAPSSWCRGSKDRGRRNRPATGWGDQSADSAAWRTI